MSDYTQTKTPHASAANNSQTLANLIEQISARLDQGGMFDLNTVIAKHPEHAERLRELLPTMLAMASWGRAPADQANGKTQESSDSQLSGVLGDFRILGELGRGGMGTVYEAEQISMGRRVALKVLPFAALASGRALQRFRNEVRAVAALDHPHIVSVYSAGEERGIHYYSMQLINGQTLADLIYQTRSELLDLQASSQTAEPVRAPVGNADRTNEPSIAPFESTIREEQALISTVVNSRRDTQRYRRAAQLGKQAAEALQHAHDQGVLHRDIKPGNLMIDSDGKLNVTDFGLARIEADAGMTMTGDIVGTLRYMAPEQALAKRVVIDHRADIYSLGATLYEVLTLQPAFGESDRSELLKRIAFDEPTPLRKLDRHIPAELETIVLHAMEKSQDDRFQTTQELADDLQRYLNNEPIQARPPTLVQHVTKWTRRHVGVVWTAVAAAMLMSATLAAATVLVADSRRAAIKDQQAAEHDRNDAILQRNEARQQQYFAEIVSGQTHLEEENLARLEQKLVRHLPVGNTPDFCDWEWYYLFGQCHQETRALQDHGNELHVTWSPDGQLIATPGKIWRVESGQCVRVFTPSFNLLKSVAWSRDSQTLAWGVSADDSAIYLWDRQKDAISTLRGASGSIWALDFSPDGKRLVSGSLDETVRIWNWATGEILESHSVEEHVTDVGYSPNGKLLAAAARDHLYVWDNASGEVVHYKRYAGGHLHRKLSWNPEGDKLAVSTTKRWTILNTDDWEAMVDHRQSFAQPSEDPHDIEWSPRGDQIAVTYRSTTSIWDVEQDELHTALAGHKFSVGSVSWSPKGDRLATTDGRREIRIWDLASSFQPLTIATGAPVLRIDWESDGTNLQTVSAKDLSVSSWRTNDGELLEKSSPKIGESEDRGLLSPNGQLRAHLSAETDQGEVSNQIEVKNSATGAVHSLWRATDDRRLQRFAWSPDSAKLAIVSRTDNALGIEIWDVDAEQSIMPWISYKAPRGYEQYQSPTWSPDGGRVAVIGRGDSSDDGNVFWSSHVHIFDVAAQARVLKRPFGNQPRFGGKILSLSWSPDGRQLAQGTSQGMVEIIDAEGHRPGVLGKVCNSTVRSVAWHPAGQRLAVAAEGGTVKIIESQHAAELLTLRIESGAASLVSWSPDGVRLVAANDAGVVKVWDASHGYEFAEGGPRHSELAWDYYKQSQHADADTRNDYLQRTLELAPDSLGYRSVRGHAFAQLGEYDQAAREFAAAATEPVENGLWMARRQAWALLGARDLDAYRTLYASMLESVHDSEVWSKRLYVAWLGTLVPNTSKEFDSDVQGWLDELVELARKEERDEIWLIFAAMLYRHGDYAEAERVLTNLTDRLGEGAASAGQRVAVHSNYFLAMTRQRMGHELQARRLLAEADSLAQHLKPKWMWQVEFDTLRREAEALLR